MTRNFSKSENRIGRFLAIAITLASVLILNHAPVQACDQSYLQLDSAKSIGGGKFTITFQVCIGGGFNPPDTAGANNYTVDFWFDIFGTGVTICKNTTADEFYPDMLNSGQSAGGCTNCRNACVFYGGLGNFWHDPTCKDLTGNNDTTCYGCGGPTVSTDCPDTLSCSNGPGTCLWYQSNDPCCNGGTAGSSCNKAGFNYFSFWGVPFKPSTCPGPASSGVGCRPWSYTDIWNGSGEAKPYCDTMYITTCGGLPDSIIARGIENTSGFSGDCWTGGDHPEQTIDLTGLPVTWNYISADPGEDHVVINWGTDIEVNNSHFIIMKSLDSENFFTIGRVEGRNLRSGFGGYRFFDGEPVRGINYYQLVQFDQNGKSSDSRVVAVNYDGTLSTHINYVFPVPSSDKITVDMFSSIDQDFELAIFDAQGKVVHRNGIQILAGENLVPVDITGLENGIYYVRLSSDDVSLTERFIRQ